MRVRFPFRFSTLLLSVIYLAALGVAGALMLRTINLAQAVPQPVAQPINNTPQVIIATPTVAPTAAPMIVLPTPVPPTPMPTAAAPEAEPVNYHRKPGAISSSGCRPILRAGRRPPSSPTPTSLMILAPSGTLPTRRGGFLAPATMIWCGSLVNTMCGSFHPSIM